MVTCYLFYPTNKIRWCFSCSEHFFVYLSSSKHLYNYRQSPCLIGKSSIAVTFFPRSHHKLKWVGPKMGSSGTLYSDKPELIIVNLVVHLILMTLDTLDIYMCTNLLYIIVGDSRHIYIYTCVLISYHNLYIIYTS